MRKLRLGAETPKGSWSPRFSPVKPERKPAGDARLRDTPRMSWVPTWKGGKRMVGLAHYFHADMAYLAEADPDCTAWDVDTTPAAYAGDDGQLREFVPDFALTTRTGVRLVRLVDGRDVDGPDGGKHKGVPGTPEPRDGVAFERYTRSQLARHPRLLASRAILYHRPRHWPREFPMHVAGMFAMRPFATLGELHARLDGTRDTWFDILSLVAQGFVEVRMDHPLGPDMPIRACSGKGHLG